MNLKSGHKIIKNKLGFAQFSPNFGQCLKSLQDDGI